MKQFKGTCKNCGVYGHKSSDCPEKKIDILPATTAMQAQTETLQFNKKRKFKGQCWACVKYGHTKMQCKKLQNMANQELDDGEDADIFSSDSDTELALVAADLSNLSVTSNNHHNFCTQFKLSDI